MQASVREKNRFLNAERMKPIGEKLTGVEEAEQPFYNPTKYRCVHCLVPATALYKQYASASSTSLSLKLEICVRCHQVVDPYAEREVLLVALDLIALRPEAYRHVLCNRIQPNYHENGNGVLQAQTQQATNSRLCQKWLQYVSSSRILHAYLLWEAWRYERETKQPSISPLQFLYFLSLSFVELVSFSGPIVAVVVWLAGAKKSRNSIGAPSSIALRWEVVALFVALVLPTSFHALTVLIQVWENTPTVRALGALMTLLYQNMAVQTIVMAAQVDRAKDKNMIGRRVYESLWRTHLWAMAAGLLTRWILLLAVSAMLPSGTNTPCTGWRWTTSDGTSLCLL